MASARLSDYLQAFRFHLFDVPKVSGSGGVFGSSSVFTLVGGFSSITNPELTLETEAVQEGTFPFTRYFTRRGSVSPILLSKGVRIGDSLFWDWASSQLLGGSPKRTLILVQFSGFGPGAFVKSAKHLERFQSKIDRDRSGIARAVTTIGDTFLGSNLGDFATHAPGRMWQLFDCIPTRYKSGSDLDARSSEVSMEELELQPEYFEERSLSGNLRRT